MHSVTKVQSILETSKHNENNAFRNSRRAKCGGDT